MKGQRQCQILNLRTQVQIFGSKNHFLFGNHDICKQGISTLHLGLSMCWGPIPKNVSRYGSFLGVSHLCKTNPSLSLTNIVKFVDWLKTLNKVERLKCLWSFVSLSGNVLIEPSVEQLLSVIDFSCGHTNKWKLNLVQEVVLHNHCCRIHFKVHSS